MVSVSYATSNGTAVAGNDYGDSTGTLTFSPGQTSQTFTIPITDDAQFEPDETVYLVLFDPINATLGYLDVAILFILDNDSPHIDMVPPAAIIDLAASTGASGTVNLSWTAPGDDGDSGTATTYLIRYATSAISDDVTWNNATQVSGEPAPLAAGTTQTMTVSGLAPGQTFYFAIRVQDEVSLMSALSNSPSAAAGAYQLLFLPLLRK